MAGRILVGVDGSPDSEVALRWAAEEARTREAELAVTTAWTRFRPSGLPGAEEIETDRQVEAGCVRLQEQVLAQLPDPGVPISTQVVHGNPASVLCELSAEADMLVVGARGQGGFHGLPLGSVAHRVAHHAAAPVVVVPGGDGQVPEWPRGPVVVGVDASEGSRRALRFAADEALARGTDLVAVTAVYWDPVGTEWVVPDIVELERWGARLLSVELQALADEPELTVEGRVEAGHPVEVLRRVAKHAALLVVGARGRSELAGVLLGSVSTHVLLDMHRPTAVLPPGVLDRHEPPEA